MSKTNWLYKTDTWISILYKHSIPNFKNVLPSKYYEAILYDLAIKNQLADISNVDINKYYKTQYNALESVTEKFVDNIMLFKIMKK